MDKRLEEMSFAELGSLFPIIISEPNPAWPKLFTAEKGVIDAAVGAENILRINHYGSTSVPGLAAKPTIDILLEIRNETDTSALVERLTKAGYRFSPQPENPPPHMMFMKGYTEEGFRGQAYHLHVRYGGDWDEIHFRDYLRLHPEVAAEYAALKRRLKERFEHDREGYTQAKTEFIKAVTERARMELGQE